MHMQIDQIQEKHYNVRERVPNWLEIFQHWHDRSAAFRATANAQYDLRYGQTPLSTMDLFMPLGTSDRLVPLHIFIHGGYWQAMDKSDFSFIAKPFVENGVAALIINYDLCPNVDLNHIVEQVREVVAWAWEEGESVGIDPHDIHVSGHSAGGHLVGSLLTTDWDSRGDHHVHNTVIKSAVCLSGLFSLTPLVHTTINGNVGLSHEMAHNLSPFGKTCFVNCPVLCVYGDWEGDGFEMQSQKGVEHFTAQGLSAELIRLENATHFDVADALADPTSPVFQWALRHAT
ncbi:alpha/beta hydrolase [Terasakiella sp. A23]|uniref:alpha/beta hydrolase n=1 Tax=Terasakiella sp. FCG-A23 TaxID=3080561 RepID=UPI00295472C6|nr:alpha/beta hydrolase [Terasakiella sp. A23]MDV7338622.1 alpha/beta hydrolase [Terasakiella sp. A23]